MASISEQSVDELGGPRSLLVKMRREHGELDRLLERLAATPSGDEQNDVLTELWRFVFPHAYAEETLVWPSVRSVAGEEGERLTLHIEQGHQKLSELTADLERTHPGDPHRAELIGELIEELRLDVREEEDEVLPLLRDGMTPAQLRRLGFAWELVRRTAPTRPHVAVSRRPPGNVVAAVPLTMIDRSRDALDRFARGNQGPTRARAEAASAALVRAAGAVERRAVVQRGERGRTRPGRWRVHRWLTAAMRQRSSRGARDTTP